MNADNNLGKEIIDNPNLRLREERDKFYSSLREEDRLNVIKTVAELSNKGFVVYATGSSLERQDYRDIDLVVKPNNLENRGLESLLEVVTKLRGEGCYIIPVVGLEEEMGYDDSYIEARYGVRIGATNIDVSLSQTPFTIQRNTEKVLLSPPMN